MLKKLINRVLRIYEIELGLLSRENPELSDKIVRILARTRAHVLDAFGDYERIKTKD